MQNTLDFEISRLSWSLISDTLKNNHEPQDQTLKELYQVYKPEVDIVDDARLKLHVFNRACQNGHIIFADKFARAYGNEFSLVEQIEALKKCPVSEGNTNQKVIGSGLQLARLDKISSLCHWAVVPCLLSLPIIIFPAYSLIFALSLLTGAVGLTYLIMMMKKNNDENAFIKLMTSSAHSSEVTAQQICKATIENKLAVIEIGREAGRTWTGAFKAWCHTVSLLPSNWETFNGAKCAQIHCESEIEAISNSLKNTLSNL